MPITSQALSALIAEGKLSVQALSAMTGIDSEVLRNFLSAPTEPQPALVLVPSTPELTRDESLRLSGLTAQLSEGAGINDDERLAGIIHALMVQFHFTEENIALLTQTSLEDLHAFIDDPQSLAFEVKYQLGIRVSYLNMAVAQAQP